MRSVSCAVALVSLLLLAACTGQPGAGPKDGGSREGTMPGTDAPATPGLYDLGGGRKQALGTLEYRGIEGGVWVVLDRLPGSEEDAETIVVIVNADDFSPESLKGRFVAANGRMLDGVGIRMAGPEMEAESLERVEETEVAPDAK